MSIFMCPKCSVEIKQLKTLWFECKGGHLELSDNGSQWVWMWKLIFLWGDLREKIKSCIDERHTGGLNAKCPISDAHCVESVKFMAVGSVGCKRFSEVWANQMLVWLHCIITVVNAPKILNCACPKSAKNPKMPFQPCKVRFWSTHGAVLYSKRL